MPVLSPAAATTILPWPYPVATQVAATRVTVILQMVDRFSKEGRAVVETQVCRCITLNRVASCFWVAVWPGWEFSAAVLPVNLRLPADRFSC